MELSRRQLLFVGAAAGGGFLVGWHRPSGPRILAAAVKATPAVFAANAFIRIGKDGRITLIMNQVEIGQGTYTSMPMLLAEELEVGLEQVQLQHAPPNDKLYANPFFGDQETGGSSSVRAFYEPLRRAGATARAMLVAAAAPSWHVDPASCRAKQGLAALAVRWDDGPNATVSTADVVRGLDEASQQPGVVARRQGDAAGALAGAAQRIDQVYQVPFLAHATMEPMNCTVHVRKDSCEVWTGSQTLTRAQATAARVTGLPLEKVVGHNNLLGGGFGRRLEYDYVTQAVRIGQQVEGPVKVVWTREDDRQHEFYRPYYYDRMAAGLDASGRPVAWTHRLVGPAIVARYAPPAFKNGIDPDGVDGAVHVLYDIPAIQIENVRHEEPVLNTTFWRGVGPTHNIFVIESFVDELAVAAKADPVEYRRALLGKAPRARAVLDLAVEQARWGRPLPPGR